VPNVTVETVDAAEALMMAPFPVSSVFAIFASTGVGDTNSLESVPSEARFPASVDTTVGPVKPLRATLKVIPAAVVGKVPPLDMCVTAKVRYPVEFVTLTTVYLA
jgi:hypothetical protein